ncbi:hypothetical protein BDW74DRAFT_188908 [Aspergillus multicolor]|uniref:uncharacterized protein n=1 Tax=Aspergillus multicolor TaxID=41759 RepID=UPI003CCD3A7F
MARAAVIPQEPPKRATRGRAKGTTTKTTTKSSAKATRAAEPKKRGARSAVTQSDSHSGSESEETDDEIGVIEPETKSRGRATGAKAKTTSTTGRGRKAAATLANDSESGDDIDELPASEAPKKRAGRPKAKKEETTKPATSKSRGRPKGSSNKPPSPEDILKENTRRNALSQDSDELSSSQGPTEIFITTGSAMLRGPAKTKKKVTFQELSDYETDMSEAPAPTARRRRGTIVAKDDDGMAAKPVRKAPAGSTRGRKPTAAKKGGAKPLSPKKATQVAKAISSYASSDGEEDELSSEKDAIKLIVHSPQKRTPAVSGLGSPVRKINFTPNKSSNRVDENGEPTFVPPKTFDFGDSEFMSSPARRPPPSPFHFTLKETPKRGGISLSEKPKLSRPETTPTQNSPLRMSARKANIGTPARSLFGAGDSVSQPNFTPGQNSPLKMSARKGIFGASFLSQQPTQQQDSTPFKSSLLMSPARKVVTPFKSSLPPVPSSLTKESRLQADTETDDETVSMYDESPLRSQNLEDAAQFQANGVDEADEADELSADYDDTGMATEESHIARELEQLEEEQSEVSAEEKDEEMLSEDEVSPLGAQELDKRLEQSEQDLHHKVQQAENYMAENDFEEPLDDDEDEEDENLAPQNSHQLQSEADDDEELDENDYEQADYEQEDAEDGYDIEPEEREQSSFRFTFGNGLEDVFVDDAPARDTNMHNSATHDENEYDEETVSEDEDILDADDSARHGNDEPTLVGEAAADHLISTGPVQPYEIEEVEDTPFMSFLLTHWAPTLPFVEVIEPTILPFDTEHRSPEPITPEETQEDASDSPSLPIDYAQNTPKPPQEPSHRTRGPRFTLLAEQFSQWKASSPAKPERPRRRGVFSLGRPSDLPSAASRTPRHGIFANAPTLSARPRLQRPEPSPPPLDVYEDDEEEEAAEAAEADDVDEVDEAVEVDEVDDIVESRSEHSRSPMAEISSDGFDIFKDFSDDESDDANEGEGMEHEQAEPADYLTLNTSVEEKENQAISPVPATPVKNPSLPRQTFHTVSKVPLKPEGEVSPLKFSRKRGRSLSITSPVRSSPRLREFVLAPQPPREPESPPQKSARLSYSSSRQSLPRESPRKSVGAQPTPRARTPSRAGTPSRSVSPIKSPRKQASPVKQAPACLSGAVVYVDVHTTEGEDASGIFIELLQQMGARCIRNWSWNPRMSVSPDEDTGSVNGKVGITHVVFKDGGVRTLEKVRHAGGLVKCVGVGWVLNCEARNEWVDEAPYAVDSTIIPRGGAKRRKSMEPRALSNINGTLVKASNGAPSSIRRPSMAAAATPLSRRERSTPDETPGYKASQKLWQTPKTPSVAALGYNMDSIGMSPATPFYLSQRSRLIQQTCPPKQTRQGLFSKASEEAPSHQLKSRLEAARRKSLAFKPAVGSLLVE